MAPKVVRGEKNIYYEIMIIVVMAPKVVRGKEDIYYEIMIIVVNGLIITVFIQSDHFLNNHEKKI